MRSLIAAVLSLVVALVAGIMLFRKPINWSSASSLSSLSGAEVKAVEIADADVRRAPVIVELFTSEGCSSCPPADAVLSQLEKSQPVSGAEVIALSEHVDYWNYIGWSDPFSSAEFSARQQAYAPVFNNDGVYTPQMIVDGQAEFVGSNSGKAQTAIARAAKLPKATVEVAFAANAAANDAQAVKLKVRVDKLPVVTSGDVAEVLLAITESNLASQVSRGENSGRRLGHTAVVRELRSLGQVAASSKAFETETTAMLDKSWKRGELRAVALVQERAHKRILGASALNLSAR
ncbi:MAG TPA: DUF1223 domain-containing protein [Blastocatellia bacterium]|nr:DUF1223 domain-containing protein [Blastocatellia bacterium]HMX28383.1 DUF1223 domain-containing protein [Blastocatellia bacterium]HMY74522.1 DUF1223 domain-containing protein [Blastocatellia bacterium]HMZ18301.1 DUF1223 domain-containing protein [Blastocatellia bacterium]HNG33073.1 DUF1223 domain-containing protein [Blastocatellia bacterium]